MKNNVRVFPARSISERAMCDEIVIKHHSYVASAKTVGRVVKYVCEANSEVVGTFWLGSGFKPTPKDILRKLSVSQKEFDKMFNSVADNKRFCVVKSIPNLGSQILKAIRSRAAQDWLNIYGDELIAIVTTIGGGKSGSVYLADNWEKIGETSGLSTERKSVSMKWNTTSEIKERFSKPTGENKKIILFTDKLSSAKIEKTSNQMSFLWA